MICSHDGRGSKYLIKSFDAYYGIAEIIPFRCHVFFERSEVQPWSTSGEFLCGKLHYRTYREKRNRITYFFRAPYMVLVVGRISTVTSLSYKQRGMAAKLI